MDEGNSSSPIDSARDDKSNWDDNMNKEFGMTKNIVMPNINTQRKGIGKSTSQGKRLEKFIDTIRITFKGRPRLSRKNIEFFPQNQLEKEQLVEKDVVENCCGLGSIKELL